MNNFNLNETYATDIQTDFRFELEIPENQELGLTNKIKGFIQSSSLPCAPGEPIPWHLPGGMRNHQAGKRIVKPIEMTWVTATSNKTSVMRMCEKWAHATYNLDDGTNAGKANYCINSMYIILLSERNIREYTFLLEAAQLTDCQYGTVAGESNELLKVTCGLIYDNYHVYDRNGVELKYSSQETTL